MYLYCNSFYYGKVKSFSAVCFYQLPKMNIKTCWSVPEHIGTHYNKHQQHTSFVCRHTAYQNAKVFLNCPTYWNYLNKIQLSCENKFRCSFQKKALNLRKPTTLNWRAIPSRVIYGIFQNKKVSRFMKY